MIQPQTEALIIATIVSDENENVFCFDFATISPPSTTPVAHFKIEAIRDLSWMYTIHTWSQRAHFMSKSIDVFFRKFYTIITHAT